VTLFEASILSAVLHLLNYCGFTANYSLQVIKYKLHHRYPYLASLLDNTVCIISPVCLTLSLVLGRHFHLISSVTSFLCFPEKNFPWSHLIDVVFCQVLCFHSSKWLWLIYGVILIELYMSTYFSVLSSPWIPSLSFS
jgi:hypothetical protein